MAVMYPEFIPKMFEALADDLAQQRGTKVRVKPKNIKNFKSGAVTLHAGDTSKVIDITIDDENSLITGIAIRKSADDTIFTSTINRVTIETDNVLTDWPNGNDLDVPLAVVGKGTNIEIEISFTDPGADVDVYVDVERIGVIIS